MCGGYKDCSMCLEAWSHISNQIRCRGWDQVLRREMLMSQTRHSQLTTCCVAIYVKNYGTFCDTKCPFGFSVFCWILRCVFPLFFFFSFVCTRNWRQRLLFMYCAWTVAENFDFSAIFSTSVGPMNSTQNLQILLFSNFFIKNWSHNTIHTFKNYFSTVFSVLAKISSIQIDPKWVFGFAIP